MQRLSLLGSGKPSPVTPQCHSLHDQEFYRRAVFPLSLSIRARPENTLDSAEPLQHSAKTMDRSRYLCVKSTRNARPVSPCKHCCEDSNISRSTRPGRLTLVQPPNVTEESKSSAVTAANTSAQRVHRCNALLLRHSKRQMHSHLSSCHDVNGMAYAAPLAPCFIHECADIE